jgi:hypothetical protein
LDDEDNILVASLDLSLAFDLVNINLMLKRLRIMGLPNVEVSLISVYLKEHSFYVSIDGYNSILFDLLLGTVQGSILGPVFHAIFVSPIFDIADCRLYFQTKVECIFASTDSGHGKNSRSNYKMDEKFCTNSRPK